MYNYKISQLSIFTAIILAGCGPQMTPEQQADLIQRANRPITCQAGKDCDAKWSRATAWVIQNSTYKIQTTSDSLIQTYGPFQYDVNSAFTITKYSQGQDTYVIDFKSACNNDVWGCRPTALNLKAEFVDFVE